MDMSCLENERHELGLGLGNGQGQGLGHVHGLMGG